MEPETIRYNLRDRMRKHRGQPRNFDIPRLVKVINGGAVQERVKMRDMHGYLEHTPRTKFGMTPGACQIVGGKMITIEPAIVTTFLKAYDDGTIEHRTEFLDTVPGQVAQRMSKSKVGGFSSAIDESGPQFFGFDYVSEPNFTLNRTYAVSLDSAGNIPVATLDDVNDYNTHVAGMLKLLDSVNSAHTSELQNMRTTLDQTMAAMERLEAENREYLSLLAREKSSSGLILDGLTGTDRPFVVGMGPATRLQRAMQNFADEPLAGYAALPGEASPESKRMGESLDAVLSVMGHRG